MGRMILVLPMVLLSLGCSREDPSLRARPGVKPTYVEHVGPLLEARCSGCHAEDREDGAFGLRGYQQAWAHRFEILDALDSMPPADGACPARPFAWSAADRVKVQTWARSGAPQGDPSEFAPQLAVRPHLPASR